MNTSRILVFSDEVPPNGGGAGVVAGKLVAKYREFGQSVTLISGDDGYPMPPDIRHIKVKRITLLWVVAYLRAVIVSLRGLAFDWIILNDQLAAVIAGMFFTKKKLAKSTIIVHGPDGLFYFGMTSFKHRIFRYREFYKRAILHCRKIVCVSEWVKQEYMRYVPDDISGLVATKLSVQFAGVDTEDLQGGDASHLFLNSKVKGKKVLLSVSRIVENKGYPGMLETFEAAVRRDPTLAWLIVGEGAYKPALEAEVKARGLENNVLFAGKIPRDSLGDVYRRSDAFWLQSEREPFGLVYLEAAHFDLPSLGPRSGGCAESIANGKSGFHIEKQCDLVAMLRECAVLRSGGSISEWARSFTTENFARCLLE